MSRGFMSSGVFVLGGKCPGGLCPGGICPGGICPGGFRPRTVKRCYLCALLCRHIYHMFCYILVVQRMDDSPLMFNREHDLLTMNGL